MTEEQKVRDYWGDRCRDVEPTCAVCAAWALFDKLKRLPTDDEVAAKTDAARAKADEED